jgi:hypothetical protein
MSGIRQAGKVIDRALGKTLCGAMVHGQIWTRHEALPTGTNVLDT